MRFEPQSSLNDDDDLPAELAPLAARLSREADALAALYPSRARGELPGIAPRKRRCPWVAAAAAVLVAAGMGTASRWFANDVSREDALPSDAASSIAAAPRPTQSQPAANLSLPAVVPAAFFHNLSAPQQEAVLDLLDDRRGEEGDDDELTRVSI